MRADPDNVGRVQEHEATKKPHVLSRLFKKDEEALSPTQAMAQEIEEEQSKEEEKEDQAQEEQEEAQAKKSRPTSATIALQASLDQAKAQITALGEARKTTNERFLHVSEEIGQLREAIIHREKENAELTVKVSRAIDLVAQVQPEKLGELALEQKTRTDKVASRVESTRQITERIIEELKQVRAKIAVFNDVEDIIKLNKEITTKLMTIERIRTIVEQHSNKVEKFFVKFEKQYQEFERFETDRKNLLESHKTLLNEFNALKADVADRASMQEINRIDKDVEETSEIQLQTINSLKLQVAQLQKEIPALRTGHQSMVTHLKHILSRQKAMQTVTHKPVYGEPYDSLIWQIQHALEKGYTKSAKHTYLELRKKFLSLPKAAQSEELMLIIRSLHYAVFSN